MAFKKGDTNINRRGRPRSGNAFIEHLRAALEARRKGGPVVRVLCDKLIDSIFAQLAENNTAGAIALLNLLQKNFEHEVQQDIVRRIEILEDEIEEYWKKL